MTKNIIDTTAVQLNSSRAHTINKVMSDPKKRAAYEAFEALFSKPERSFHAKADYGCGNPEHRDFYAASSRRG